VSPNGGPFDGLVLTDDKPFGGANVTEVPESTVAVDAALQVDDDQFSMRGSAPGELQTICLKSDRRRRL
jgi:hypothetical protein